MAARIGQLPLGRAVLVLLLLAGLMVLVAQHGMASVVAARNPELALRISPGHADAQALVAFRAMSKEARPTQVASALRAARAALMREPLSAVAAGGLGLANDQAGRGGLAARQMAFSERLSRRELVVQLWLIEDAVARDDIPLALRHYDTAMRVSRDAPGLLFPILIGAVEDPAIRGPLADLLARRPAWSEQLIQQLAQSGTAFDSIARLYGALRQRGAPVSSRALATVTGRMVDAGRVASAWGLFASHRPKDASREIRNGDFSAPIADPTPFDWVTGVDAEIVAEQRPAFDGLALYFETPMGVGGVAARQLLRLAPGAVTISARASDTAGQEASPPFLRLSCFPDRRELGRGNFPLVGPEGAAFTLRAVVPQNCPAQWLEVVTQASETLGGASGYVDTVRLAR